MEFSAYLSWDGFRAVLVLGLAISQATMAFWPEWRRWPHTIATRSAGLDTPVVPAGGTFAIWGPIFAGCLCFAVWHALPHNLMDPVTGKIGWIMIAVFAANTLWELIVPKRGFGWSSIALISIEAVGLGLTLYVLEIAWDGLTTSQFWLIAAPLHLFAGWVTAAVVVNLSSVLKAKGIHVGSRASILLLVTGGFIGSGIAWQVSSVIFPLAVCWAFGGIVVAALGKPTRRPVLIACVILIVVLSAVTVSKAWPLIVQMTGHAMS